MATLIESNRGKRLLVFENYKFTKANKKLNGTTRWKCIERKCAAVLYTDQTNKICSESENIIHRSHDTRNLINRQIVNIACKKKLKRIFIVHQKKKNYARNV